MKRQNILIYLIFGLFLISLKLSAENQEGRFRINEGDWFESKLDLPFNLNLNYQDADIINKLITEPGVKTVFTMEF